MKEHGDKLINFWRELGEQFKDRCPIPATPGWNEWIEDHIFEIIQ